MKRMAMLTSILIFSLALVLGGAFAAENATDLGKDQPNELAKMYENTQVVSRYYEEVLNRGDLSKLEVLFSDGSQEGHVCAVAEEEALDQNTNLYTVADVRNTLEGVLRAYSNIHVTIDDISAKRDTVNVAWTFSGVFNPTGNPFKYTGTDLWRLENGKIVGRTGTQDLLSLARQNLHLGAKMQLPAVISDYRPSEKDRHSVASYYDNAFDLKSADQLERLFASDFVDHSPDPGQVPDRNGFMRSLRGFQDAFLVPRFTIDELRTDGDKVRVDWTFLGVLEMTKQKVTFTGTEVWAVKEGALQERWGEYDLEGLVRSFGMQ